MHCPTCGDQPLHARMTQQGVEVDRCRQCHGIWLDKGEIFYFTKRRKELAEALQQAQRTARPSTRLSPKTGEPMQEIAFFEGNLVLDVCLQTEGLWFDEGEIDRLVQADPNMLSLRIDTTVSALAEEASKEEEAARRVPSIDLLRLPNLFFRAVVMLLPLYALLALMLILVIDFTGLPPIAALLFGIGLVVAQFLFSPWLLDRLLRWFYAVEWVAFERLPMHLQTFIRRVCIQYDMHIPRIGIIDDSGPNAFAYGHTSNNARIVITQGILERLDEDEVEAVVAHEIGHAKHWDMVLVTVAQLVPLILYNLYCTLVRTGGNRRKIPGPAGLAAIGVYLLYVVSQVTILWFSRSREFLADRFAGEVTKSPNSLASALVKIAYGLAGQESSLAGDVQQKRSRRLNAIGALGVFDANMAQAFAVSAHDASTAIHTSEKKLSRTNVLGAMKWELWNPWAGYYELQSTHPRIAKRMRYLSNQAEAFEQSPFLKFSLQKPESYWDEFLVDILVMYLPSLVFLACTLLTFFTHQQALFGLGLIVTGIFSMVKLFCSYPKEMFPLITVSSLLKNVKVSAVRPVSCSLKGKIIGRGIPGRIWSEDFIMRDYTGIMFLEYRQPLRIWEFLFGALRSKDFQDEEVTVEGWYRRSPVPYIEIKTFTTQGITRRCHAYTLKKIFTLLLVLLGFVLAFVPIRSLFFFL